MTDRRIANGKQTIYIQVDNEDYWLSKPKHSRSAWVNRKLKEEAKEEINDVIKGEFIPIKFDQWGNPIVEDEV